MGLAMPHPDDPLFRTLASCRLLFLLLSQPPTTGFTAETFLLFTCCEWWSSFETKDLVHWFSCGHIIAGEPALSIKWTGIFMLPPI